MPAKSAAKSGESPAVEAQVWEEILPFTPPREMEPGDNFVAIYDGGNEVEVPDPNAEDGAKRTNLLHEFREDADSDPFGIWGSAGLDKRLAEVPKGSLVKLEYQGKVDLDGGRTARQYRVWTAQKPF